MFHVAFTSLCAPRAGRKPARARVARNAVVGLLLGLSVSWAGAPATAQVEPGRLDRRTPGFTPHQWQPKLLHWNRDKNRNFVEDGIENLNPDARVDVFLDLNQALSREELQRFEQFGRLGYVGKYLSVAQLREVRAADAVRLGSHPFVAMVEWNKPGEYLLDRSVAAIRVRSSTTYSPNTVQDMHPGLTGIGVTIAILDSGVDDGLHESLPAAKYVGGYNDPTTNVISNPDDTLGHGTHVAGIALGTGGPLGTFRGVAHQARLVDIRVGAFAPDPAWVIAGIDKCIEKRDVWNIRVISMSLGLGISNGNDAASQMANQAVAAGIVVVNAAGNSGPGNVGLASPASADDVITVANSNDLGTVNRADDTLANTSSRGPRDNDGDLDATDERKPEVAAPGSIIRSAQHNTVTGYVDLSGTSMASPHVSGLAALLVQANPGMAPLSIKQLIINTAEDKGPVGYDNGWGHGLINGFGAVNTVVIGAKTDLKFDVYCHRPGAPAWWESPDLYAGAGLEVVTEGVPTTVTAIVTNQGPLAASNFLVRIGYYQFGSGQGDYHIATVPVVGPLASGATLPIVVNWTPNILGPAVGDVHACLKAEIIYALDANYVNNCAQHNIDVSDGFSGSSFQLQVVNPLAEPLVVEIVNDFRDDGVGAPNWVFSQSRSFFEMGAFDGPQNVEFSLRPVAATKGAKKVSVSVIGTTREQRRVLLGGGSLYARMRRIEVRGTVRFGDFVGDLSQQPVTLKIFTPGGATPLETHVVVPDKDGRYRLVTGQEGVFDVSAKAAHWLEQRRARVAIDGDRPLDFRLINGDVNNDNALDNRDLGLIRRSLGLRRSTSPQFDARIDLNGDNVISNRDLSILERNLLSGSN